MFYGLSLLFTIACTTLGVNSFWMTLARSQNPNCVHVTTMPNEGNCRAKKEYTFSFEWPPTHFLSVFCCCKSRNCFIFQSLRFCRGFSVDTNLLVLFFIAFENMASIEDKHDDSHKYRAKMPFFLHSAQLLPCPFIILTHNSFIQSTFLWWTRCGEKYCDPNHGTETTIFHRIMAWFGWKMAKKLFN